MGQNIEQIKKKLSTALDFLKEKGAEPEYFQVLLFLLVLKRKNSLPKTQLRPSKYLDLEILAKVEKTQNQEFIECFDRVYEPLLDKLEKKAIPVLISQLDNIGIEKTADFAKIFDWLLYRITESGGRFAGQNLLPEDLKNFMVELIDVSENSIVYNPFAGFGSFGIKMDNTMTYVGQEIDEIIWAQGILRRIAHEKQDGYFLLEDSVSEWISHSHFDFIISAPPFGRITSYKESNNSAIKSYDQFVLEKGIDSLKPGGKIITLVTDSLFYGAAYLSLRKKLIDQDLIHMIVSLPAGILNPYSNVKISVLVLYKDKRKKGSITLVDGSYFQADGKKFSLKYQEIKTLLLGEKEATGIVRVTGKEVTKQDYNLEVSRYSWKESVQKEENVRYLPLSTVFSDVKRHPIPDGTFYKIVSIKNLTKNNLDYRLNLENVEKAVEPIRNAKLIKESCLLVARIGNDLKPTYFQYQEEPIAVANNVMCFKVAEERVDLDFLVNELYSDFVVKQLDSYRRGMSQQTLAKTDFLQITFPLPSLQKQRDKMKGVKETFIKTRLKEIELQKEVLGLRDEAFREFASIKHTFRQYLNALKSNVAGTRKFITRNEGKEIRLDTMYSKNLERTLGEHLLSLEGTIDSMSRLLSEEEMEEGEAEVLAPKDLIEEAQNRFKNPEVFKFEKVFVDHEVFASEEGYMNPFIKITKDGFFRIFANIVANAVDHGFKNRTGNIIRTAVSFEEENRYVLIEVSNNGKPIPEGFTQNHLTTRGEKTTDSPGTGAGGADIKGILQKYDAKLELVKESKAEFPVTYVLKFPLFTLLDRLGEDMFNLDDINL